MKTGVLYSLALILVMAVFAPAASATSLRCGTHLIQGGGRHGPTMYEVLKKCGEPAERHGHIWIYQSGGQYRRLHFGGNGILLTVQRVD